ncbi:methyltransferase domain-containing protein [Kribbella sp. C-35]|uniref:methyltransferase domain-containing protein n=1 Tax=Kribbella sp. C-35 TaxID=2789276 RepID=UPI00397ACCD0
MAAAGFTHTGVDLSPASVDACRELSLHAEVASILDLPFEDATFDAGWTMSTSRRTARATGPAGSSASVATRDCAKCLAGTAWWSSG